MNQTTKTLVRLFFLFLPLFLASCTPSWQEYMDLAQSLQSEKRSTEAIAVYEEALKKQAQHREVPNVYLKVATLYYTALQQPDHALETYQTLIESFPKHPTVRHAFEKRALIFEEQEAWVEAISAYEDILQRFPKSRERTHYQFKIALFHQKRGDFKQAQLELERIIQQDSSGPWSDDIYFQLGEIYFGQGEFKQALDNYRKVVQQYPKSPHQIQATYNAGLCLEHFGEWDEALTLYHQIEKTYPNQKMIRRQIELVKKRRQEAGRG